MVLTAVYKAVKQANLKGAIMSALLGLGALLGGAAWKAAKTASRVCEAVQAWEDKGLHATNMWRAQELLGRQWWLGPLRPKPPLDPLEACGLVSGKASACWWRLLLQPRQAERLLACLEVRVLEAEHDHKAFGVRLFWGIALALAVPLGVVAARRLVRRSVRMVVLRQQSQRHMPRTQSVDAIAILRGVDAKLTCPAVSDSSPSPSTSSSISTDTSSTSPLSTIYLHTVSSSSSVDRRATDSDSSTSPSTSPSISTDTGSTSPLITIYLHTVSSSSSVDRRATVSDSSTSPSTSPSISTDTSSTSPSISTDTSPTSRSISTDTSFTSPLSTTSLHTVSSSSSVDRRATVRKKNKKWSRFLSKCWKHIRRATQCLMGTCAKIKAEHDKGVRAMKRFEQEFDDHVWFPRLKDERIIKETEKIFAEFEIYFEKERLKQAVPILGKSPSHH